VLEAFLIDIVSLRWLQRLCRRGLAVGDGHGFASLQHFREALLSVRAAAVELPTRDARQQTVLGHAQHAPRRVVRPRRWSGYRPRARRGG
jgi:hypothetical protein